MEAIASGGSPAPSRARAAATVLIAYVVLTLAMTWPFVNYRHFASASYGGDARLIIWTLAWDNHATLGGLPLFDANVFFPAPHALRYNEHLLGVSLATLPWAAAGASPVLAYNITWWLAFLLNGLATYAWLRRVVPQGAAAFAGSLVFTCSFYVMLHVHGHLHLVWLWPLPLSALLLERWFRAPSTGRAALWGAAFLMGVLTSWYMAVITALVNGIVGAVLVAGDVRAAGRGPHSHAGTGGTGHAGSWRTRLWHLAVVAAICTACVLPLARQYVGMKAGPGEAAAYSADLASYLIPPEQTLAGRWWKAHVDARPRAIYGEQTLFAGWLALLLGGIGATRLVRGRVPALAWTFPLLVVAGFLLSLGPAPPLLGGPALAPFGWLTALPGFSGMRAPGRFALVAMLGLAGLVALATSWMLERQGRAGRVLVAALVPLMLAEWFVVGFPGGVPEVHDVPAIYRRPEVLRAAAIASLPDYRDKQDWFQGGDYLYYATSHWRPIVNGFGRTEPPNHAEVVNTVRRFAVDPGAVRALGVEYVVVHAARLGSEDRGLVDAAMNHPRVRLAAQDGDDYLFELLDAPVNAAR